MRFPRHRMMLALTALAISFGSTARAQSTRSVPDAASRPDFGTSSPVQYHVAFSEFTSTDSTISYFIFTNPYNLASFDSNTPFVASPHIPTGAQILGMELDYCDTDTAGHHVTLVLRDCAFGGDDCHGMQTLTSSSIGCGFVTANLAAQNYTMLNNVRELVLEAFLTSGSVTNRLSGAYITYKLQVSPAPAVATFTDVPTTSPQFKFVEALFAAGITAGCGGGNFCPNQPLTRGQMAVFLSTALGLHFPD